MSIYDDHSPISDDILEWLLGDEKVASKWKELAIRLHLEPCIPPIDQNISIKRKKFDKQKLKEFMSVWRRASPKTYTQSTLIRVLGQVGCTDMINWLILLRTGDSRKKIEISSLIDASRSTTPLSYSPYSWYSNGGGSNEDRPESSRSFNSDDRDSSPSRPLSSCSSSETLRKTMTKTITTRTIEKRFYTPHSLWATFPQLPDPFSALIQQQHTKESSSTTTSALHSLLPSTTIQQPSSSARSSSLKGSQSHLVNTEGYAGGGASSPCYSLSPASTLTTRSGSLGKPHKVVSFKDTTETYDNYNNEEAYSSNKSLDSLPELLEPLPKGISMDKYFDNLISMITDAAEDLKV
ncbi:NFE2L1_3 [Lepeophtheirus salmonis]|uniref:NFE2L1_3 n=1 Tax=Lepeophtheirus salmonis TaxID=72036 RepID=A0A7R8H4U6_LEPSM|nr:NFE2L1_3 [Lepeophtheirus salmonis]CAF2868960.1 NFE2L1_3 [Lepeophtheirus salmonis]